MTSPSQKSSSKGTKNLFKKSFWTSNSSNKKQQADSNTPSTKNKTMSRLSTTPNTSSSFVESSSNNNNNNGGNTMAGEEPPAVTMEQLDGIESVRMAFQNANGGRPIPADLDTDFNLLRWWWTGSKGGVPEISRRLSKYVENRQAARLDGGRELLTTYQEFDRVTRFIPYFDCSPFEQITVNPETNRIITVFRLERINHDHVTNFMNSTDVMNCNFLAAEFYTQAVLEQERVSGRRSGVTCVVDCTNLPGVAQYMNPNSVASRMSKIILQFLAEWYSELVAEVIVFNPPYVSLVHFVIKMASFFLPERTIKKVSIAKNLVGLEARVPGIPLRHRWTPNSNGPWTSSKIHFNSFQTTEAPAGPLPSTLADGILLRPKLWPPAALNSYTQRPIEEILQYVPLKSKSTHVDSLTFFGRPGGARILWWFTWSGNGDVELAVRKAPAANDEYECDLMYPKFILASFKIPEEGFAYCDYEGGEAETLLSYTFAIRNLSHHHNLKLTYAFEAFDAENHRRIQRIPET